MKNKISNFITFIVLVGMMITFGSCKKDKDSVNLIGTWNVTTNAQEGSLSMDITFNTDGSGTLKGLWKDLSGTGESEEMFSPFNYNFDEKNSAVTLIDANNHNDIAIMQVIWHYYFPELYNKDSKQLAFTYGVQVTDGILKLTDSNKLTVPFTKR